MGVAFNNKLPINIKHIEDHKAFDSFWHLTSFT